MVGLARPAGAHASAIATRAEAMLGSGLLDEARAMAASGASRTAAAALGYGEAFDVIEGRLSCTEAVEAIAARTRELARRQRAWFRADPRVAWMAPPSVGQALAYFATRRRAA
jgi:tRNA dimethylallyltransferase